MKKILIVKTSSLGDIIHTYPVVDYLHKKFPSAQIDWVVEAPYAELAAAHPFINQVLTVSTKQWRKSLLSSSTRQAIAMFRKQLRSTVYDVAFDLQGNTKSGLILSQVRASCKVGFGRRTVPEWPNVLFTHRRFDPPAGRNIREDYLSIVTSYFGDPLPEIADGVALKVNTSQQQQIETILQQSELKQRQKVMVCPGSAWPNKQLSEEALEGFLELVQKKSSCSFLFVWGSTQEQAFVQRLHKRFADTSMIVDRMSLPALQNLMGCCDLVIAMDSLPLHLAGTTATPSFSVFGPSLAEKYRPLGAHHHAYQGSCPYGRSFAKRCPILRTCPTGACIRSLTPQQLFSAFEKGIY